VSLMDAQAVREAFQWLADAPVTPNGTLEPLPKAIGSK
jgi:hypothetical protein